MTPDRKRRRPRIGGSAKLLFGLSAAALVLDCGEPRAARPLREEPAFRPPLAGVSARLHFQVEPLTPGEMGADTLLPIYHGFLHRCSACHEAPSPRQFSAALWPRIVERMGRSIDAAGLLPLEAGEAEEITELLQRNASRTEERPFGRRATPP